uniref:Uncharacterized protein n=1 Tax=Chlorobium chlorochromatii (strain CaD3) TaxID=340177 RepID=Q3ARS5_CHLCH
MKKTRWLIAGLMGVILGSLPLSAQEGFCMSPKKSDTSIVINSQQSFIELPDQGFSVSVGSPYDIINYDNRYYIYQDGSWYRSSNYRGTWTVIRDSDLPDRIRRHRPEDIRRLRDNESRRYENDNRQYRRDENNRK